jgi:hypothetical protein
MEDFRTLGRSAIGCLKFFAIAFAVLVLLIVFLALWHP